MMSSQTESKLLPQEPITLGDSVQQSDNHQQESTLLIEHNQIDQQTHIPSNCAEKNDQYGMISPLEKEFALNTQKELPPKKNRKKRADITPNSKKQQSRLNQLDSNSNMSFKSNEPIIASEKQSQDISNEFSQESQKLNSQDQTETIKTSKTQLSISSLLKGIKEPIKAPQLDKKDKKKSSNTKVTVTNQPIISFFKIPKESDKPQEEVIKQVKPESTNQVKPVKQLSLFNFSNFRSNKPKEEIEIQSQESTSKKFESSEQSQDTQKLTNDSTEQTNEKPKKKRVRKPKQTEVTNQIEQNPEPQPKIKRQRKKKEVVVDVQATGDCDQKTQVVEKKKKIKVKQDIQEIEPSLHKSKSKKSKESIQIEDVQINSELGSGQFPDKTTIKLACWNVNGIRAVLRKDTIQAYMKEGGCDIICLNETKISEDSYKKQGISKTLKEVDSSYEQYWSFCKVQNGYSGVGILAKSKAINVTQGIGVEAYDNEGRILTAEFEKFVVITVYVPFYNQTKAGRQNYREDFEEKFQKYVKTQQENHPNKPVIVCGDFNVAHHQIDVRVQYLSSELPGFTLWERKSFNDFLKSGWVDSFRFKNPHTVKMSCGQFIKDSKFINLSWRFDYFLIHEKFIHQCEYSDINQVIYGSDHYPVEFTLNVAKEKDQQHNEEEQKILQNIHLLDIENEVIVPQAEAVEAAVLSQSNPQQQIRRNQVEIQQMLRTYYEESSYNDSDDDQSLTDENIIDESSDDFRQNNNPFLESDDYDDELYFNNNIKNYSYVRKLNNRYTQSSFDDDDSFGGYQYQDSSSY